MNYADLSNVRRIRWYRSADRDLPLDEWEMVADLPFLASDWADNTPNETGITHYYFARYVFKDGQLSGASDIKVAPPYDPKDAVMKQNPKLN